MDMYNKLMSDFAPLVRAVSQVHVRFDEQMQLPASPLYMRIASLKQE